MTLRSEALDAGGVQLLNDSRGTFAWCLIACSQTEVCNCRRCCWLLAWNLLASLASAHQCCSGRNSHEMLRWGLLTKYLSLGKAMFAAVAVGRQRAFPTVFSRQCKAQSVCFSTLSQASVPENTVINRSYLCTTRFLSLLFTFTIIDISTSPVTVTFLLYYWNLIHFLI